MAGHREGMTKEERRRTRRHAEHKRYYAKTAFLYEPRPYSEEEDVMILAHAVPDSELSIIIRRSMKAICNRRWRLRRDKRKQSEVKKIQGKGYDHE